MTSREDKEDSEDLGHLHPPRPNQPAVQPCDRVDWPHTHAHTDGLALTHQPPSPKWDIYVQPVVCCTGMGLLMTGTCAPGLRSAAMVKYGSTWRLSCAHLLPRHAHPPPPSATPAMRRRHRCPFSQQVCAHYGTWQRRFSLADGLLSCPPPISPPPH